VDPYISSFLADCFSYFFEVDPSISSFFADGFNIYLRVGEDPSIYSFLADGLINFLGDDPSISSFTRIFGSGVFNSSNVATIGLEIFKVAILFLL
jgi:hypothetical protein